ncbi:MAG: glycosyltransferase [Allobranchiibius sp.]
MIPGTIYFLTPDLPTASGGIQVIYGMVKSLRKMGFSAAVWHGNEGHSYPGLDIDADVVHGRTRTLQAGDVLVVTEVGGPKWSFLANDVPVVVLNQGHDYTFHNTTFEQDVAGDYPGWPTAVAAIATSRLIEDFLNYASPGAFPVYRIPVVISPQFAPRRKQKVLALMPRRRSVDLTAVVQLLRRSGAMDGWRLQMIDGMTQQQVAEAMGEAAIFLSGAEYEGFGLPQAEAIAAGCYLVGFTGAGGREFMSPDWCSPIYDEDVLAFARAAAQAMADFDRDPEAVAARVEVGRAYIRDEYNAEKVNSALLRTFGELLGPHSAALVQAPTSVSHYQAFAPSTGVFGRSYVAARTVAGRLRHRRRR